VLHDEDLAQAIIDRLLERGRLLRLDGPSVRTPHVNLDDAMKEDSDQPADLVRIPERAGENFRNPQSWYSKYNRSSIVRFVRSGHARNGKRSPPKIEQVGDEAVTAIAMVDRIRGRSLLTQETPLGTV
jgi:hypothetical protein